MRYILHQQTTWEYHKLQKNISGRFTRKFECKSPIYFMFFLCITILYWVANIYPRYNWSNISSIGKRPGARNQMHNCSQELDLLNKPQVLVLTAFPRSSRCNPKLLWNYREYGYCHFFLSFPHFVVISWLIGKFRLMVDVDRSQ